MLPPRTDAPADSSPLVLPVGNFAVPFPREMQRMEYLAESARTLRPCRGGLLLRRSHLIKWLVLLPAGCSFASADTLARSA